MLLTIKKKEQRDGKNKQNMFTLEWKIPYQNKANLIVIKPRKCIHIQDIYHMVSICNWECTTYLSNHLNENHL